MGLCTLTNLKARMGITSGGDDTLLNGIIAGVSARMAKACGRALDDGTPCLEISSDVTEVKGVVHRDEQLLYVRAWPVVSITSITESLYGDWAEGDTLADGDDYHADLERGLLYRIGAAWLFGSRSVRVIYTGGYTAAGDTPGDGETALPADVAEAAMQQCAYLWDRRAELGATGASAGGGSLSWAGQYKLLDDVADVCAAFRRLVIH